MNNFHRNIFVLLVAVCFAAVGFINGGSASAQTKTSAKAAPTAKTQKSPAKTATASDAIKKSTAAKTADKNKAADKSKTASKSADSSKEKSAAAVKSTVKSPTEKKASAKTNAAKTAPAKTAATAKSANEKTSAVSAKPAAKSNAQSSPSSSSAASQIIVAATSACVRSEPNQSASVVSTVNIGKILPVAETNSAWYRVSLAGEKSGWISKQIAADFADARRAEIYQKIVGKYFKSKMDFATAAQIFAFLTDASAEVKNKGAQADLNLKRLQALGAALKAVPSGKGETENPYKTFLKTNENQVVYSEPSGEWYVRSDVFWETHGKYKDLPVGEEIAWLAAQTPLPGECEGYINCYLYLLRVTDGEYLNFYPSGKYARKSIQNITSLLEPIVADLKNKTVYTAPGDISDRAEFNRLLTELRQIISKVPFVEKAKAVQQINQIGEGFR